MALYNFKESYYNINNINVEDNYSTSFYTYLGNGDGTRNNPANAVTTITITGANKGIILGGGRYNCNITSRNVNYTTYVIGQGIDYTRIKGTLTSYGDTTRPTSRYKDISFDDIILNSYNTWNINGNGNNIFNNCQFYKIPSYPNTNYSNHSFSNNIFHFIPVSPMTGITGRNTYIGGEGSIFNLTAGLYHKCNIAITIAEITSKASSYTAFNDCTFKIGEETSFIALNGTTPDELRADFVLRCEAQGVTPANVTEGGETLAQGRWVFTKGSIFQDKPYKGSDIHNFEIKRNLVLGFYSDRFDAIHISNTYDTPNTFINKYASSGLVFNDKSLVFDETINITDRLSFKSTSKINWLGGKKELLKSYVPNTFLKEYGVLMDSTPNLDQEAILPDEDKIETDNLYFVRSSDKLAAEISYNGVTYNTDVVTVNNRFRGVDGITSYSVVSGNPIVFRLKDILQFTTLQIRIVNKIPAEQITSGNLVNGYWYLVEHDTDQTNTTDYITYDGVNYKSTDSFLVNTNLTFTKTGNIHLRRCWKDAFDFNTETIDKDFWADEQKPKWFDVIPDDLRCLKKSNSVLTPEMQVDEEGNYVTSGHPNFYHILKGDYSYLIPSFGIRGTYAQFRLNISTQNLVNVN